MSVRLGHDVAWETAAEVIRALADAWATDEEREAAFRAVLPLVTGGIARYERRRRLERERLAKPQKEGDPT